MKSEYQIYMDFRAAEQQVDNLRSLARQMRELAESDMNNTINTIRNNWSGENADAYLEKAGRLRAGILRNADDIERIAGAVYTIADNTRKSEERAIQIAREKAAKEKNS